MLTLADDVYERKSDPFVVHLGPDAIAATTDERQADKRLRDGQFESIFQLLGDLNTGKDDQKIRRNVGVWLYHELPFKPDQRHLDSLVFRIADREQWSHIPWEFLNNGTDFLLAGIGARFHSSVGTTRRGTTGRILGPLSTLKVAYVNTAVNSERFRDEFVDMLDQSSSFYHIQGKPPAEVRTTLRSVQPHIVIMDTSSSTYLRTTYYDAPDEENPPEPIKSGDPATLDELTPGWPEATVDYLFDGAAPPLVIAPAGEDFAMDALAAGADTVILGARNWVPDDGFCRFAKALLETLGKDMLVADAFDQVVPSWRNREDTPEDAIPLIFSRFPYYWQEYDNGIEVVEGTSRVTDVPENDDRFGSKFEANVRQAPVASEQSAFEPAEVVGSEENLEIVEPEAEEQTRTALPTPGIRTATQLSSYRSDVAATVDRLGVQADVENICQVIMAERWKPPLSIGLFGDWGSGKTSFINLMRKTINATAKRARDGDSAFVEDVIQIDFNAWHYLDANLWANLVVRILEGIQKEVFGSAEKDEEGEEYRQIFDRLHVLQEEVERCNDEHNRLKSAVTDIDNQIDLKVKDQDSVQGQLLTLQTALADSDNEIARQYADVQNHLNTAIGSLELPQNSSLTEARAEAAKYRDLWSRIREAWSSAAVKKWWLILPLAAVIYWITANPEWEWLSSMPKLKDISGAIATLIGSLVAWSQALAPKLKTIGDGLTALQSANTEVARFKSGWVKAKQEQLADLETRKQEALDSLNELKSRKAEKVTEQARLEDRIEQLERGKGLEDFLMSRAGSTDYQQQLGIIALVHKDMRMLQQKLRAGMKAIQDGQEREKKYDRVILYIDDLDRCTPARVVEVLQAIHLLLSIPLFVVVVAVDPGWLHRCLLTHYQDLLHKGSDLEGTEWLLTPQNYLEKIFQIPFTLPTMGSRDFPGYVDQLFELSHGDESDKLDRLDLHRRKIENELTVDENELRRMEKEVKPAEPTPDSQSIAADTGIEAPAEPEVDSEEIRRLNQRRRAILQKRKELLRAVRAQDKAEQEAPDLELRFDSSPRALDVSDDEKEFVKTLLPLLTTPRMAKRMLNVYRLIRVSLREDEIDAFADVEHQAVLVLLAIMYSYPSIATEFFTGIRSARTTTMTAYILEIRRELSMGTMQNHAVWRRLLDSLQAVEIVPDLEVFDRWVRVVGRYSFQVGHELAREQPHS